MTAAPDIGGQGLPINVSQAASEYLVGANYAFALYGLTGHAAGELIEIFVQAVSIRVVQRTTTSLRERVAA